MVRLTGLAIAILAAGQAVVVGGAIGWTGLAIGAFAVFELALWADLHWPESAS